MSEQLSNTIPKPITPDMVDRWMKVSDYIAPNGPTNIDRGNGIETVEIVDTAYKHTVDVDGNPGREPVVVINNSDGLLEVPTADYMNWIGFKESDLDQISNPEIDAKIDQQIISYAGEVASNHAVEVKPALTQEQRQEARLRELFAPAPVKAAPEVDEEAQSRVFDRILDRNDDLKDLQSHEPANYSHEKKNDRGVANEANRKRAVSVVHEAAMADSTVEKILGEATGQDVEKRILQADLDIVDKIRTDPELRYQLGKHYLDKITRNYARMPSRIGGIDVTKSPKFNGYGTLPSRDYVALLALAMLDGSFDYSLEEKIYDHDARGVATLGQHRAAARTILNAREY